MQLPLQQLSGILTGLSYVLHLQESYEQLLTCVH